MGLPKIVFNRIFPSTLIILLDSTSSKPLITLMVIKSENTPIANPIIARFIAFEEKLHSSFL